MAILTRDMYKNILTVPENEPLKTGRKENKWTPKAESPSLEHKLEIIGIYFQCLVFVYLFVFSIF